MSWTSIHTRDKKSLNRYRSQKSATLSAGAAFQRLVICLFLGVMALSASGCGRFITFGQDHFGVGWYAVEQEEYGNHLQYKKIEGVGLLAVNNQVSLGYTKHRAVTGEIDDDSSYYVITPIAEVAVGREAERLAQSSEWITSSR